MSNQSDTLKALAGTLANDRGGESQVNDLFDVIIKCDKPAADGAASDTTNRNFWRNLTASTYRVVAVQYVPDGTLTSNDTTYATLSLLKGASAAVTTSAAAVTTKTSGGGGSGDWVADTPVALTLSSTAANLAIAANDILCLDIAKASTGVAVPAGTFIVQLRRT